MTDLPAIAESYVVDTHALFWFLTGNKRLSITAMQVFVAAERGETRLVVSAIALAELFFVNAKLGEPIDFRAAYGQLATHPAYRLVGVSPADIADVDRDSHIPEMHDRILAGLARRLACPIITRDQVIMSAVDTVW